MLNEPSNLTSRYIIRSLKPKINRIFPHMIFGIRLFIRHLMLTAEKQHHDIFAIWILRFFAKALAKFAQ